MLRTLPPEKYKLGRNSLQIETLNNRHYRIIELALRGLGNREIAETLGMTTNAICIIMNSASFQHELALRRQQLNAISNQKIVEETDDVAEAIRRATKQAVRRLVSCIDSEDEAIAMRASTEILDRGGHPKVMRNENKTISVNIASKDAAVIKETLSMLAETTNSTKTINSK